MTSTNQILAMTSTNELLAMTSTDQVLGITSKRYTFLAAAFGLVLVVSLFKKEDGFSRDQVPQKFAKGL